MQGGDDATADTAQSGSAPALHPLLAALSLPASPSGAAAAPGSPRSWAPLSPTASLPASPSGRRIISLAAPLLGRQVAACKSSLLGETYLRNHMRRSGSLKEGAEQAAESNVGAAPLLLGVRFDRDVGGGLQGDAGLGPGSADAGGEALVSGSDSAGAMEHVRFEPSDARKKHSLRRKAKKPAQA